jgi:hypothetical protein
MFWGDGAGIYYKDQVQGRTPYTTLWAIPLSKLMPPATHYNCAAKYWSCSWPTLQLTLLPVVLIAPGKPCAGKPFFSRPAAHPGPSDYRPADHITRRSAPASAFHGSSTKDSREGYPAPNAYTYEDVHKKIRPSNPPITLSPKYPEPYMGERRPGPGRSWCISWGRFIYDLHGPVSLGSMPDILMPL